MARALELRMRMADKMLAACGVQMASSAAALKGLSDSPAVAPPSTLFELCERFLAEYRRPRIKDIARYRQTARSILRQRVYSHPIKELPLSSLSYRHAELLRDDLMARGYEHGSINQTLKLLSTLFRWAQRQEYVQRGNPLEQVERMPDLRSPDYYSREQIERLLAIERCPAMVATAIYTGMRKGELLGLTWESVNLKEQVIEVRRSYRSTPKSGRPRVVPLHPELVPALVRWRAQCPRTPEQLVFPVARGTGYGMGRSDDDVGLASFLQSVGIPHGKRPWHAFRHSFATLLCEAGSQRDAIAELLGHAAEGSRITGRYIHLSLGFLRQELAKLSLRPNPGKRAR